MGPIYSQANLLLLNQVTALRAQVEQLKRHCLQKQQSQQRQINTMVRQQQQQTLPPIAPPSIQQELEQLLNKALNKVKHSHL
jgi:hypothetical protein